MCTILSLLIGCIAVPATSPARDAQRESEGLHHIPGKPLTMWVPDPDLVDWSNRQDRPGYRYRGLLPVQQRFYVYIQDKRARGLELSWADRWMIANLQTDRRWPGAPVPDEITRAFMRHLREKNTDELTWAERATLGQLISRGVWPADPQPDPMMEWWAELLQQSRGRSPRNWFERTFGPGAK